MNVAIHSQGVALTEALCLHISQQLRQSVDKAAALVEQATLALTIADQRRHDAQVLCRLTITVQPSITINITASASTPYAAIDQATAFLKRALTSPRCVDPAPTVHIPVVTRIPAAALFRRCARTAC